MEKRNRYKTVKKQKLEIERKNISYKEAPDDFDNLLFKYGVRDNFSQEILDSCEKWDNFSYEETYKQREDLTEQYAITIDGEDAKDFDDAISLKKEGNEYILDVHIADVSYYVQKGSPLDMEAYERGTSIYLIHRVVPMLPAYLSNNLCSLVQGKKRLTITCRMKINPKGQVYSYGFFHSTIENRRRTTYKELQSILDGNLEIGKEIKDLAFLCHELKEILYKKRIEDGSLDLSSIELGFEIGDNEVVEKVFKKERIDSQRIIEEFMLLANQCCANMLQKNKSGLYRIHEPPDEEKIQRLIENIHKRGGQLPKGGSINPLSRKMKNKFQIYLEKLSEEEKEIFSYHLLTSMKQAQYKERNYGHFGLAFKSYTHFTSPIRRYPDLIVHRMLSRIIKERYRKYSLKDISTIAHQSSQRERRAMAMEREYQKIKSIRYLEKRIGEEFQCVISGVIEKGVFVRDIKTGVEGFLDYFWNYHRFGEKEPRLEIGSEVRLRLKKMSLRSLHVDFEPL